VPETPFADDVNVGSHRFTRKTWGVDIRETVLAAARGVISKKGASHLTMDAVAAEAGISKGGLLYYFPSKDTLWRELLRECHKDFIRNCLREFLDDPRPDRPGRIHRAWIRVFREANHSRSFNMAWSDVAILITNIHIARPVRAFWQSWTSILTKDGLSEESSLMVRMSLEGCKMWRLMDLGARSGSNESLFAKLLEIATIENQQMDYETEGDTWERCLLNAWKEM
jgi:AcrR family transcriptional regulator